jgi:hypothetical protein
MDLPAGVRRLFPHYEPADLDPARGGGSLLVARLLEDGDGADLAWLAGAVPEPDLAAWLERRGGRQLSVRSRAFWQLLLGRPAAGEPPAANRSALWPL